jgi:3-deoxy-D-manno-octulosonate 8-phosphate phosphatase (KDO 8-P phosphatase)
MPPTRREPGRLSAGIIRRMRRLTLVALDVDGVLTDGALPYVDAPGGALDGRWFNVKDGLAVKRAAAAGIACVVVTSKVSSGVARRCADMGIAEVVRGREDKGEALRELLARRGVEAAACAYMGDDLLDLAALRLAGLGMAPSDAAPEVLRAAHYVTRAAGGAGCVREALRAILTAKGAWDEG